MSDEDEDKCKCKAGLPAWMGTFADLMSLLMCFFVLLLSFSEMDAMKFKRLAGSMAQAFGVQNKVNVTDPPKGTSIIAQEFSPGRPEPTPINEIFQTTQDVTEMSLKVECSEDFDVEQGEEGYDAGVKARVKEVLEELEKQTEQIAYELADALSAQILAGQIEIETEGRKIIIRIREKGSFGSGSATLKPEYRDVLQEVQAVLALKPGHVKVEGHTDNIPINTARFRSNWELSSARAVSVAHELMRGNVINSRRFEVSGMADTKPLASNNSADDRAKNRRVEILILQSLDDDLSEDDKAVLQSPDGADILRDLKLEPDYLFELQPEEIF
ncbi:flagellar motor protein MotB [Marinagarivorans cellulosilyticus]|uniref:Chemotaxis protein MotB n=1 Tax=Marinagarivorans cellulosilyticus TaxID=2721545 RepID=A0AAN1WHE3_9GAMM|nr:flagellar motor protein MotB [Marinagarivorans cellulosilyticus]BCD97660.1 chemotaxis protein MotB [Marinagarivorans cellulosilyticus]